MLSAGAKIIEGPYLDDLLSQPAALRRTLGWLGEVSRASEVQRFLASRRWKRVVLTGMGSSFHSLHPINLAFMGRGEAALMIETSELIHYGMRLCDPDTLLIAVSQSGSSVEILRLLDLDAPSGLLAVTNAPAGRLATKADCTLLTQAGSESTVSCKTYLCGLMALQWLADLMAGIPETECLERLRAVPDLVEQYLSQWRAHVADLADWLAGVRNLFLVGRGLSLAAVGTGALIIKEAARTPAEGMSSAAFRHGPMECLQPGTCVAVFAGPPATRQLNHRLASELAARGRSELIGSSAARAALRLPDVDPWHLPVLEILPVQMITLALAALAGREAGRFEVARKVTDTE
jgi:glutamine---fructose-6-phosphate transaminase (isomerizing)